MFLRLLKLILKSQCQIEKAKQILFGHETFDIRDCFDLFNIPGENNITAEKFEQVFIDHSIEVQSLDQLVYQIDQTGDNKVNLKELSDSITPRSRQFKFYKSNSS